MKKRVLHPAIRIAALYTLVAGLWIVFSDRLLALVVTDPNTLTSLQSVRGLAFVLTMAALLYAERLASERNAARAALALQQAENRFRSMFASAPIGIFQATTDGRYLDANPAFASMLGYASTAELLSDLNAPDGREAAELRDTIRPLLQSGAESLRCERRYRRRDDRWIDARLNMRAARNAGGTILYIESFAEDISEQKANEQKLQQFADLVNASGSAIIALTPDGLIRTWNPGAQSVYGYSAEEIEGRSLYALAPSWREAEVRQHLTRLQSGQVIQRLETEGLRKNGAVVDVAITASPIRNSDGTITGISLIARDISERKALDRRLHEQQKMLEHYASRVVRGQEEERRRLSRLLHDETMQELVALVQRIELCRSVIERDPALARRRLDELQALPKDMLARLRRISNDLHPPVLEDLGLSAAMTFLSDELARQMPDCAVRCQIIGRERRLPGDLEVTAFRVIQAALSNIRRQAASATRVDVTLIFDDHEIRAVVQDNGPGRQTVQASDAPRDGSLDAASMQERARLFGGEVTIQPTPGQGVTVTLRLPTPPADASPAL